MKMGRGCAPASHFFGLLSFSTNLKDSADFADPNPKAF